MIKYVYHSIFDIFEYITKLNYLTFKAIMILKYKNYAYLVVGIR